MTVRSLGLGLAVLVVTACLAGPVASRPQNGNSAAGAATQQASAGDVTLTVGQSGRLYVSATIEAVSGPFWLDPWEPLTLLTPETVTRLQRGIKDGMVQIPPIRLGGIDLATDLVAVNNRLVDVSDREDGIRPLGVIGGDLISRLVVEFDLDKKVLRLNKDLANETAGDDILMFAGADTHLPIVEVRIHETLLRLLLDPTSEGVLLPYDAANRAGLANGGTMDLTMRWQNRTATMPVFGQSLDMGPIHRTSQVIQVLPPQAPLPVTPLPQDAGFDGILGQRTLTTHRVIVDYPRSRVILRPRQTG